MCIPPSVTATKPDKEITEAHLAAIWNEQSPLRGPMWDCAGQPVAVVYRGRWSAGSGPDFSGAMLTLGEDGARLLRGDVEMHLRCADWYAHGHDTDPRYNGVALHVVLWPLGAKPVTRADGVSVPTLVLADYITLPAPQLVDQITPLLPNLGTLSEEPCWQRTQHWPIERLMEHIEAAGDARMEEKTARMEADLDVFGSLDEVLYRGLLDALGYSSNREPMLALATAIPLSTLTSLPYSGSLSERATLLEAVLLGAAGLLPSQRPDLTAHDWVTSDYIEDIERLWQANAPILSLSLHKSAIEGWQWDRTRPANSPPRRLAAMSRLLARYAWTRGGSGLSGSFLDIMETLDPSELAKEWIGMLAVPGDGYWANHSDFGRPLAGLDKEEVALLGSSRAADMLVNILLPLSLAYADTHGKPHLRTRTQALYVTCPRLAENKITKAMADEAFGPRKRSAAKTARHQQGLLHLYRLYCEARRCYECPVSGLLDRT
ncbi:MAG: DUF2851 family protein [Chloroflexota bacterium]